MEKEINRHLDAIEDMEDKIDVVIEDLFLNLDIEDIIEDPVETLVEFIQTLNVILDENFYSKALKEGILFGKNIREKDV